MRCAFLTTDKDGLTDDDQLAATLISDLGGRVTPVAWQAADTNWSAYDRVVVRSTWDYHLDSEEFMNRLAEIEESGVDLRNPLELIRWNVPKTYLQDLQTSGISIVPTVWREGLKPGDLNALIKEVGTEQVILKPVVSASAEGLVVVESKMVDEVRPGVERSFSERPLMAQPFVDAVTTEGEFSLVYFDGHFSHGVVKKPQAGDFRVQQDFGGRSRAVDPEPALLETANQILATLPTIPTYSRVDLARSNHGDNFWLMELELIEPELFLGSDPQAARRFAQAVITERR